MDGEGVRHGQRTSPARSSHVPLQIATSDVQPQRLVRLKPSVLRKQTLAETPAQRNKAVDSKVV